MNKIKKDSQSETVTISLENETHDSELNGKINNNKKYLKLIETSKLLFFKHGIKRVTIEEICTKANVSKMTFYKFFKNKNELVIHILKNIFDENTKIYFAIMEEKISFIEKIKRLIILKLDKTDEYGEYFIQDLMEDNSGLLEYMLLMKNESDKILADFLRAGQDAGVIRKTITPELQNYYYDLMTEMFKSERLTKLIPNTHQRLEEVMNMLFYGIGEPDLSTDAEIIIAPFII